MYNEHQIILIEALKKIGYTVRNYYGSNHYRIINNLGLDTEFIFNKERIELKNDSIFGADRRVRKYSEVGWIIFHFKACEIEFDEEYNCVHISNKTHDIYITFNKIEK